MTRTLRILRRVVLALVAIVVLVLGAAVVVARTDRFRDFLRERVVLLLNETFRGEVSLGRMEGFILTHLALHDFALRFEGRELLRIPRVDVRYSVVPLLWGRLDVFAVEASDPVVRTKQTPDGKWDLLEALASRTPAPTEPAPQAEGGMTIALDSLVIKNGLIEATPAAEPVKTYQLAETELSVAVVLAPAGIQADVHRLTTRLTAPGLPVAWADASLAYDATKKPIEATVERFVVATEQSRVKLDGRVPDVEALDVDLRLAIERIAGAEIAAFAPQWPPTEDVTGVVRVSGPRSALVAKLDVAAAGAKLVADAKADATQTAPPFEANVSLENLDVARFRPDAAGVVKATVRARGVGAEVPKAVADATLDATGLRFAGWQLGDLRTTAGLADEKARIEGELGTGVSEIGGSGAAAASGAPSVARAPGIDDRTPGPGKRRPGTPGRETRLAGAGRARFDGEAELSGERRYRIGLVTEHLNPRKFSTDGKLMAGDLNLRANVDGRGFEPASMDTRAELTILPSRLDRVSIRKGRLDAHLAANRVRIREGAIEAENATANVTGELPLGAEGSGTVRYAVVAADIGPWLRLAGQDGTGRLSLRGEARGNAARVATSGELGLAAVALGERKLERATLRYDVKDLVAEAPNGTATLELAKLDAGVRLESANAAARLFPGLPQRAHLDLEAREETGRKHELRTDVVVRDTETTATLTRIALELPDGLWQLEAPARVTAGGGAVAIDRLSLRSGDHGLAVAGRFAGAGKQDLTAEIDRLPLASLAAVLPKGLDLEGTLAARAAVTGTAESPAIDVTASLAALRIAKQPYDGVTAKLAVGGGAAVVDVVFRQDATHSLTATGRVPIALAFAPAFRAEPTGDLDFRARSAGLSLSFLNAFGGRNFREAGGDLFVDLAVTGPVAAPKPRGQVALYNGTILMLPLNVRVTEGTIETYLSPESVSLSKLWLRSGDGKIWGSGVVTLAAGAVRGVDAIVQAEAWPAIYTNRYQAALEGWVSAGGTAEAPKVFGKIAVMNVVLRPDLEFLGKSPPPPDGTIQLVRSDAPPPPPSETPAKEEPAEPPPDVFKNTLVDMTIDIYRNSWVKHDNATVELEGSLWVSKRPGTADPAISGSIRTVRGWAVFQGKRFLISEGNVIFTGDVNPTLDIVAQYKTAGYLVEAVVSGNAQKPSLELRSDPELEQADILSVLIFGKPADELNEGQQDALGDRAQEVATSYAATALAQSAARELGVEEMGIQIEELTTERVALGKYVTDKTYVRVGQEISGEQGQEVAIEYQIFRNWEFVVSTTSTGNNGADLIWHKKY